MVDKDLMITIGNAKMLENRSDNDHTARLLRSMEELGSYKSPRGKLSDEKLANGNSSRAKHFRSVCYTTDGYMDALGKARQVRCVKHVNYNRKRRMSTATRRNPFEG